MKKLLFSFRCVVAALLVAFLFAAPKQLDEALGRNFYREWLAGTKPEWSGVITLWHIAEFKSEKGSLSAYLENIAACYERKYPGVYIEVTGLSPNQARERLSAGEKPHLWSFPMGAFKAEQFNALELDLPKFRGNLEPLSADGAVYALPYMYSGYFLIGNTVLVQQLGLSWSSISGETNRQDAIASTLKEAMASPATRRYGALFSPKLYAAKLGLTGTLALEGDFKAGQVPFMLGDARALGDLNRKMATGGFTFDALPLGGFTEQVLYIGVDIGAKGGFLEHGTQFIELLLTKGQQLKLTALGAIPATAFDEVPKYQDSYLQLFFEAYSSPCSPSPSLYFEHKAELDALSEAALRGDEGSLELLLALLIKLGCAQ